MAQSLNDAEVAYLIHGAQAQDKKCCARLYELFAPRVYRYLRVIVRDEDAAQDLTADVFVRLLEHIKTFRVNFDRTAASFTTYVFRIAHNIAIDHVRANSMLLASDEIVEQHLAKADGIQYDGAGLESVDLERAMAALTPEQREVLMLRFGEDMAFAEIAAALGKTEGAVKALQVRALNGLARRLDDNEKVEK